MWNQAQGFPQTLSCHGMVDMGFWTDVGNIPIRSAQHQYSLRFLSSENTIPITEQKKSSHHRRWYFQGEPTYFINSKTIQRGITSLHHIQQPEGGWVGSWGVCFSYATMFALESLGFAGETYETSESVRRACDFLVSKQRADSGWGESYKVCVSL